MIRRTALCILFIFCYGQTASAETWHVTIDGLGDVPTIQAAIDSAAADDTVLVGPGHYTWSNQGSGDERGFIRLVERKRIIMVSEAG